MEAPPNTKNPEGLMSRRQFLRNAGIGAGIAVGGIVLGSLAGPQENEPPLSPEQTTKSDNPEFTYFINNHPLLVNLSSGQKKMAEKLVEQQVRHYKREGMDQPTASLKDLKLEDVKKRAEDSARWRKLIYEKAENLGYKTDSFAFSIACGMIFVESEGDKNKPGGLFQLDPELAQTISNDMNIDLGENNIRLNNPDINTTIALEYIDSLYKVFPDPSICAWAFNLGERIMGRAIYACVLQNLGTSDEQIKAINDRFESKDPKNPATAYYIRELELNFINILKSVEAASSMRADLKELGEDFDEGHKDYVPRILAGEYIIQTQTTA